MNTITQSMTKCKYCGAELMPIEVPIHLGDIQTRIVGYEECNCEQMQEKKRKQEEKEYQTQINQEQQRRVSELRRIGISNRTFDCFSFDERNLADEMLKTGIYLYGTIGTGKTTAAELALINLYDHGHINIKIVTAPQLISTIRQGYNAGSDVEDYIRTFSQYKVLVIDDIGKEAPTEDALMLMYRVIDERYKSMKPTSYTSNYKRSELIKRLSQNGNIETAIAIVSRMSETKTIEYKGSDKRLENNISANVA